MNTAPQKLTTDEIRAVLADGEPGLDRAEWEELLRQSLRRGYILTDSGEVTR